MFLLFLLVGLCSSSSDHHFTCDLSEDLRNSCIDEDHFRCPIFAARGLCHGQANADHSISDDHWTDPFKLAVTVNALCPQSCRRYHRERNVPSLFVQAVSGMLQDHHVDILGARHEICDLSQGWTFFAIYNLLLSSVLAYASFNEEKIVRYTKEGYRRDRLEPELWEKLQEFYQEAVFTNGGYIEHILVVEKFIYGVQKVFPADLFLQEVITVEGINIWSSIVVGDSESHFNHSAPPTSLIAEMDDASLQGRIVHTLQPLAEEWSGRKLQFATMYGIRRYLRGAKFMGHVDRRSTHVISAIINVGQNRLEEPWPLQILDHAGKVNSIILEPGEVLWYESSK